MAKKIIKCSGCGTTDVTLFTARQLSGRYKDVRCSVCRKKDFKKRTSTFRGFFTNRLHSIGTKRKDLKVAITIDDVMALWESQNGLCAITGLPMTWGYSENDNAGHRNSNASIDRIHNDADYTPDNIRLICMRANYMRGDQTDSELYFWCRAITEALLKNAETKKNKAS